jgi:hypothetical protein
MRDYMILSDAMGILDDEVIAFFDGEYEYVHGWVEGEGRGMSSYDVFTDGRKNMLRAEHYGFDDTYYRFFFIECPR